MRRDDRIALLRDGVSATGDPVAAYRESLRPLFVQAREQIGRIADAHHAPFEHYQGRELEFIRDILGKRNDVGVLAYHRAQRAIVEAAFKHRYVVVRSPRKASKTYTLGDLALTILYTRPSIVLTLAPTHRQVERQVWGEIRETLGHTGERLGGKQLLTRIELGPKHYMEGIATDQPGRIQGYHAGVTVPDDPDADLSDEALEELVQKVHDAKHKARGHLLALIIDEAAEIKPVIWEALQGSMQGQNVMVVATANPTVEPGSDHPYAHMIRPNEKWHRIHISHLSTELYPDPLDADQRSDRGFGEDGMYGLPNWIQDRPWIEERKRVWGEHSALFKAHVLGQCASEDTAWQVISEAILLSAEGEQTGIDLGPHMGVDVSAGGDYCVAALWVDGIKRAEHAWRPDKTDPTVMMTVLHQIIALAKQWGAELAGSGEWTGGAIPGERIHIDSTSGWRALGDRMREMGWAVDEVDFSESPRGEWSYLVGQERFINLRAELHWIYRRGLQEHIFSLPREFSDSWQQAQWPRFEEVNTAEGTAIRIEKKAKIITRHGRSPDNLDADLLAFARPSGNLAPTVRTMRW